MSKYAHFIISQKVILVSNFLCTTMLTVFEVTWLPIKFVALNFHQQHLHLSNSILNCFSLQILTNSFPKVECLPPRFSFYICVIPTVPLKWKCGKTHWELENIPFRPCLGCHVDVFGQIFRYNFILYSSVFKKEIIIGLCFTLCSSKLESLKCHSENWRCERNLNCIETADCFEEPNKEIYIFIKANGTLYFPKSTM